MLAPLCRLTSDQLTICTFQKPTVNLFRIKLNQNQTISITKPNNEHNRTKLNTNTELIQ